MATGQGGVPLEAARPAPPRVGLIVAAVESTTDDPRWVNGFAFQSLDCIEAGRFDPCADDTNLVIPDNPANVEYVPFAVWAGYRCAAFDSEFDWTRAVTDALLASESKQIAAELWRGDIARDSDHPNAYLTDDVASDDLNDNGTIAPVQPLAALACLEEFLGDCADGQQGMIHATRQLVTMWNEKGVLRRDGNRIYTIHDTIVVSDGGYDGSGPNGRDDAAPVPAGATQFAYATGLVTIRRQAMAEVNIPNPNGGDPLTIAAPVIGGPNAEGMDRTTNTAEVRAERIAAATWSGCCHAHVEVDLPACGVGGS